MDHCTNTAVLACVAVLYIFGSGLAAPQDCVVHNLLHVSKTPKTLLDSRLNLGIYPQVDDWNATLAFLPQHAHMLEPPFCVIHLHHQVNKDVGFTDVYIRCLADNLTSAKDNLYVDGFSNQTIYSTRLIRWSSEVFQNSMWTELWVQVDHESGKVELAARRANAREGFHFKLGFRSHHVHLLMHSEEDLWVYYNCHTGCPLFHEESHKVNINSYTIYLLPGPAFEALYITYFSKTDKEIHATIRGIHLHNSDGHWYNITAKSIANEGGLQWLHILIDGEPVQDDVAYESPLKLSANLEVRLQGEGVYTFDCNPKTVLSKGTSGPEDRTINSSLSSNANENSLIDVECLLPWVISGILLLALVAAILSIIFCQRNQRWDLLQGRNHTENVYTNVQNCQHEENLCNRQSEVNHSANNSPSKICSDFGFPLKPQTDSDCSKEVDNSCVKSSWERDKDGERGRADGCSADFLDSIDVEQEKTTNETHLQEHAYEDLENAYEDIPS